MSVKEARVKSKHAQFRKLHTSLLSIPVGSHFTLQASMCQIWAPELPPATPGCPWACSKLSAPCNISIGATGVGSEHLGIMIGITSFTGELWQWDLHGYLQSQREHPW